MSDDKRKKKRPFGFFGFDEEFEKMFEELQRMAEEAFSAPFEEMEKPFVHGFSIRIGPDGKPRIQEFGNRPSRSPSGEPMISEEREPLTDLIEGEEEVSVTVEIPGVPEKRDSKGRIKDINLEVTEDTLEINVDIPQRKYHKLLDLPCEVEWETTKATYKNGVLDIVIKKKKNKKKEKKGIKIDID